MATRFDLTSLCGFACLAAWLLLLSPGVQIARTPASPPGAASSSSHPR